MAIRDFAAFVRSGKRLLDGRGACCRLKHAVQFSSNRAAADPGVRRGPLGFAVRSCVRRSQAIVTRAYDESRRCLRVTIAARVSGLLVWLVVTPFSSSIA